MRRTLAEHFKLYPVFNCPLCHYKEKTEKDLINHLIFKHTDEEAWEVFGDLK